MFNTNDIYKSALNYTLKKRYGYKTPLKTIKRFNQKNSDLNDICKYIDQKMDLKNKTKKDFLKILNSYLSPYNRIFRTFTV